MLLQFVSNIIASFAENSVYLRTRVLMLRFLVILVLGLQLAIDLCNGCGFEELCRKQYCNNCNTDAVKNCNCPAKNGSSMGPSESAAFSCSDCSPNTMYEPYVCKYCYKGKENEAFSCQRCKFGKKPKPVICDECKANPDHASQDTGWHTHLESCNSDLAHYGRYRCLSYYNDF